MYRIVQPRIEIALQLLHRFVELLAKLEAEELIFDRLVKTFDEPVRLGLAHFGAAVLQIIQGQIQFVRMQLGPTELAAIVGEHRLHRQPVCGRYPLQPTITLGPYLLTSGIP